MKYKYISKKQRIDNFINNITSFVECDSIEKLVEYLTTLPSSCLYKEIQNIENQLYVHFMNIDLKDYKQSFLYKNRIF